MFTKIKTSITGLPVRQKKAVYIYSSERYQRRFYLHIGICMGLALSLIVWGIVLLVVFRLKIG